MLGLVNKKWLIVITAAVFAAGLYGYWYWSWQPSGENTQWIFNTPDETANYFFATRLASGQEIAKFEPANVVAGPTNIVQPRSMMVVDKQLVPGSFLGFILLLGYLGKIFTPHIISLVIPIFSAAALLAFYYLLKHIFTEKIARWSVLALIIQPAFWYYSSRSLFGNALLIDGLLIGLALLVKGARDNKFFWEILGMLVFSLALTIRPNEIILWGIIYLIVLLSLPNYSFKRLAAAIVLGGLAIWPTLYWQAKLYGSPWITGYVPEGNAKFLAAGYWGIIKQFIMPFGFSLKAIVKNFLGYLLKLQWWYILPALGGWIMLWRRRPENRWQKIYLFSTFGVAAFLLLYYGSWQFADNLLKQVLIGSSQMRYFLPLSVLLTPLAVWAWFFWLEKMKTTAQRQTVAVLIILMIVGLSTWTVLSSGLEALTTLQQTILRYQKTNQLVRQLTTQEAIIVSNHDDKVFFPSRRVAYYWQEPGYLAALKNLIKYYPVYFYTFDPAREIPQLQGGGLRTQMIAALPGQATLYQIIN